MELRHLRDFVAVAEELSFTRAAARLHLAQPSLTRQIKDLEEEIGVRLLNRGKVRVSLTEEGTFFLAEAKRVLALSTESVQMVQQLSRGEAGQLHIGYIAHLHSHLLPASLAAFRGVFPKVKLQLFSMTCRQQLDALESCDIDLGFVGLRECLGGSRLMAKRVGSYQIVVALPEASPISRRSKLALSDLEPLFFVTLSKALFPGWSDWTRRIVGEAGFTPQILQETDSIAAAIETVATGLGIALLPEQATVLVRSGVVFRLLTPELRAESCIAWRRDCSRFVQEYIEILRSVVASSVNDDSVGGMVNHANGVTARISAKGFKRHGPAKSSVRLRYQRAI